MPLLDSGKLAIAELVYWAPALVLASFVTFKHGFDRHAGWLFIVLLALARIIGASCTIAAEQQTTPNVSLLVAAGITNSIGLSFLIQTILGLLTRVTDGTPGVLNVPTRVMRWLHLLLLAGIIVGIVGGTDLSNGGSDYSNGLKLLKASIIIFAVALVLVGGGLAVATAHLRMIPASEKRLIFACLASFPFILVRLIYSLLVVFVNNSTFSFFNSNVWARAFMAVAEEFVVASIVIAVGFMADKVSRGRGLGDSEAGQLGDYTAKPAPSQGQQQYGFAQGQQSGAPPRESRY